jgi:hypothetical protein
MEAEFKKLWGEKVTTLVQKVVPDQLTSNMDHPGVGRLSGVNKSIVCYIKRREKWAPTSYKY